MADPFLSEIRLMSFAYAPTGWAMCNGQLLPINQNQALFSLLGTTYGGNGQTNFALPDLRGRIPIHVGNGFVLGQRDGEQAHTLTIPELPTHMHMLNATSADGSQPIPVGNLLAKAAPTNPYSEPNTSATAHPATIANVGGSQAHQNMQPFLTLTFSIALQGIFPSPT